MTIHKSDLRKPSKILRLVAFCSGFVVLSMQCGISNSHAGETTISLKSALSSPKWGFSNFKELECNPKSILDLGSPANAYRGVDRVLTFGDDLRVLMARVAFLDQVSSSGSGKSALQVVQEGLSIFSASKDREIEFNLGELTEVITLDRNLLSPNGPGRRNLNGIVELLNDFLEELDKKLRLSDLDVLILVSPSGIYSHQFATSIALLSNGKFPSTVFLGSDFWRTSRPWTLVAHELGHVFGLLDLYSLDNSFKFGSGLTSYQSQFVFMGPFDFMNNPSGSSPELTLWNRWLLGSVNSAEIFCFRGERSSFVLNPVTEIGGGYRGVFIKQSENSLIIIENRQASGYDRDSKNSNRGLLIYRVDLLIETGKGPLRLLVKGLCGKKKAQKAHVENVEISCHKTAGNHLNVKIKRKN